MRRFSMCEGATRHTQDLPTLFADGSLVRVCRHVSAAIESTHGGLLASRCEEQLPLLEGLDFEDQVHMMLEDVMEPEGRRTESPSNFLYLQIP